VLDRRQYPAAAALAKGGYILADSDRTPDIILIGSGSEVHLCLEAREMLAQKGVAARVVSMPSWELFDKTTRKYQDQVLPSVVPVRVAVEAGIGLGWEKYVGSSEAIVGINRFGASAPGGIVMKKYGMTAAAVVTKCMALLKR
jgi:transketolase